MRIPVTISRTADERYRADCQTLPGCTITADSFEDAALAIREAVCSYLASLNVVCPMNLEFRQGRERSECKCSPAGLGEQV